jgi:hypothetical protein
VLIESPKGKITSQFAFLFRRKTSFAHATNLELETAIDNRVQGSLCVCLAAICTHVNPAILFVFLAVCRNLRYLSRVSSEAKQIQSVPGDICRRQYRCHSEALPFSSIRQVIDGSPYRKGVHLGETTEILLSPSRSLRLFLTWCGHLSFEGFQSYAVTFSEHSERPVTFLFRHF